MSAFSKLLWKTVGLAALVSFSIDPDGRESVRWVTISPEK
jgi:hypothetical protein